MQGYGTTAETLQNAKKITLTVRNPENVEKIWSSARFASENYLKKRHLDKITEDGRIIQQDSGKSVLVVTRATPLEIKFNMKEQKVTTTFYVQRYDRNERHWK